MHYGWLKSVSKQIEFTTSLIFQGFFDNLNFMTLQANDFRDFGFCPEGTKVQVTAGGGTINGEVLTAGKTYVFKVPGTLQVTTNRKTSISFTPSTQPWGGEWST